MAIEKSIIIKKQSYDMGITHVMNTYEVFFNTVTWDETSNLIKSVKVN